MLLILVLSLAQADMAPPPLNCPTGSLSYRKGRAQWCLEIKCERDEDCIRKGKGGLNLKCEAVPLCIEKTKRTSRIRLPNSVQTSTYDVEHVQGDCSEKGECSKGECSTAKRCYSVLPPQTKTVSKQETKTVRTSKPKEEPKPIAPPATSENTGCVSLQAHMPYDWVLCLVLLLTLLRIQKTKDYLP